MTPKKKTANSTTLMMERKALMELRKATDDTQVHVAGGDNRGIIVNKRQISHGTVNMQYSITVQFCYIIYHLL